MADVTQILSEIEQGDQSAAEQLLPLVYNELRQLAAAKLAHEKPGQTLQPTALVHEAYLRLVDQKAPFLWNSRRHFFAAAAEAMRRILVDRARERLTLKRGGGWKSADIEADEVAKEPPPEEVIAVHDALDALKAEDPLAADIVQLHYFSGFSIEEAATLLSMSRATAYRLWTYARASLRALIERDMQPP